MKKLSLEYPVVVEGKYDKIKLDAIVATPIITLDGFSFFNDKKKQQLFRKYAENGIIILTDSDRAGAFIRSKLRGYTKGTIINVYAPSVIGKEKRKSVSSKDGLLGVEGIDVKTLRTLLTPYEGREKTAPYLTKARMYADGLSGGENSSLLRHTARAAGKSFTERFCRGDQHHDSRRRISQSIISIRPDRRNRRLKPYHFMHSDAESTNMKNRLSRSFSKNTVTLLYHTEKNATPAL